MAVMRVNRSDALTLVIKAIDMKRYTVAMEILFVIREQERMHEIVYSIPTIATTGPVNEVIPEDGGGCVDIERPYRNFHRF